MDELRPRCSEIITRLRFALDIVHPLLNLHACACGVAIQPGASDRETTSVARPQTRPCMALRGRNMNLEIKGVRCKRMASHLTELVETHLRLALCAADLWVAVPARIDDTGFELIQIPHAARS